MTLLPKDLQFVSSPCGAHTVPRDGTRGVPVDLGPELRRTLGRIKRILGLLNENGFTDFGEVWFPHGTNGSDQVGAYRGYVLDNYGGITLNGSSAPWSWNFVAASEQYFKAKTKKETWTLSYDESWSVHLCFDADRYNSASREVLLSIGDDADKPFILHLEASGSGGGLVATATDAGGTERSLTWSGTITNNTDHWVSVYYDAANTELGMSVDGEDFETLDLSAYTFSSGTTNPYLTLGAGLDSNGDPELWFDGEISVGGHPVCYMPRQVISISQAKWLYNNGSGRSLVGQLPLDTHEQIKTIRHAAEAVAFTADAGTDKISSTGHGLSNGNELYLFSTTTLPAGLATDTKYYVVNAGLNDFEVSLESGGSTVDITDAGTGTHTYIQVGGQNDIVATEYDDELILEEGPNIDFTFDPDINRLKIASTHWTPTVGMVMMWAIGTGTIPEGWAIMNGTANSIGNGGSGIDMTDQFVKGNATTAGTVEGATATAADGGHQHSISSSGAHTHSIGSSGAHTHTTDAASGNTGIATTGITIDNHDEHYHGKDSDQCFTPGLESNIIYIWGFPDDSTVELTSGVLDGTGSADVLDHTVNDSGHTHTLGSHTHTIASSGAHTHSIASSGAHTHTTDSDGSHTHTTGRPDNTTLIFIEYIGT